jgi:hypothetical protein
MPQKKRPMQESQLHGQHGSCPGTQLPPQHPRQSLPSVAGAPSWPAVRIPDFSAEVGALVSNVGSTLMKGAAVPFGNGDAPPVWADDVDGCKKPTTKAAPRSQCFPFHLLAISDLRIIPLLLYFLAGLVDGRPGRVPFGEGFVDQLSTRDAEPYGVGFSPRERLIF